MSEWTYYGLPPSGYNLPPGVSQKDLDGPDPCPTCEGEGEVLDPQSMASAPKMLTCPECRGTGLAEDCRRAG